MTMGICVCKTLSQKTYAPNAVVLADERMRQSILCVCKTLSQKTYAPNEVVLADERG